MEWRKSGVLAELKKSIPDHDFPPPLLWAENNNLIWSLLCRINYDSSNNAVLSSTKTRPIGAHY